MMDVVIALGVAGVAIAALAFAAIARADRAGAEGVRAEKADGERRIAEDHQVELAADLQQQTERADALKEVARDQVVAARSGGSGAARLRAQLKRLAPRTRRRASPGPTL